MSNTSSFPRSHTVQAHKWNMMTNTLEIVGWRYTVKSISLRRLICLSYSVGLTSCIQILSLSSPQPLSVYFTYRYFQSCPCLQNMTIEHSRLLLLLLPTKTLAPDNIYLPPSIYILTNKHSFTSPRLPGSRHRVHIYLKISVLNTIVSMA